VSDKRDAARAEQVGRSLAEHLRSRGPELLSPSSPWVLAEQIRLAQLVAVGAVTLLVGWFGLSGTLVLSRQASFLAIALGGLLLSSAGLSIWLLAGLRAIRARRVLVREGLLMLREELTQPAAGDTLVHEGATLVAAPSMTRYHRPSCPLVEGKSVTALSLVGHVKAGRLPCGVCEP
jgi:hypothetical protein